jgi:hypothetical protein
MKFLLFRDSLGVYATEIKVGRVGIETDKAIIQRFNYNSVNYLIVKTKNQFES